VIQDALPYKIAASAIHSKPHLLISGITKTTEVLHMIMRSVLSYNFTLMVGRLLEMFTLRGNPNFFSGSQDVHLHLDEFKYIQ